MTDRPSRQDLVVSTQTSNLRFALTAAGCACAGFGLVWAGLAVRGMLSGRAAPTTTDVRQVVAAPADFLPSTDQLALPSNSTPATRFTERPVEPTSFGEVGDDAPAPAGRYADRGRFGLAALPAQPELIDTSVPAIEARSPLGDEAAPHQPFGLIDPTAAAATTEEEPEPPFDDDSAAPAAGNRIDPGSASLPLDESDPVAAAPSVDGLPDAVADDASHFQNTEPPDNGLGAVPEEPTHEARLPEDLGDVAAPPAPQQASAPASPPSGSVNPLRTPTAPAAAMATDAPPAPPFAAPPLGTAPAPQAAFAARSTAAEGRATGFSDPPAGEHDDGAPVPAHIFQSSSTSARGGSAPSTAVPFAAAPPIGPPPVATGNVPPMAGALSRGSGGPQPPATPPTPTGQGRPGAIQLEGVQTPQLAVEKRGPREIQVGKTARFEILVRNVGNAIANDVVLRDSVPFGTALVATTPPAAPTPAPGLTDAPGTSSDLVWQLGTLPPGGQARVALDLMPMQEGDVGSVASVSFRADASVRARATRAALQLTAEPPAPVLVGLDSRLTITISNPGSGVATGVVLEGVIPEGITHRAGHELEFDVGSLPPGESRSIDLVLATTGPGVHGLRLTARADGQIEVSESVKIAVTAPTLELAVQMPTRRYLQRPATCVLSMTNAGTAPALGVELVAQLPPGMKFIRANNAGYYEERTHRVLWNLEELPAAETGQVEVVVMPIALGPQKIVAAARTTAGLSDQIGHTVEVEGLAALAFEVADSEDPIEVGGVSEYVIRVSNQGTKPASGVRVVATLLGDMEPVEARGPSAHRVDNLTISFEPLAKLAPSEEATYRIRVRGRREGDQRVQVQLTSDEQPAPITKEEITRVYADR
ncbi:MAG: DUF11 domain-containing protein [Planctomycetota bacterium]|nr:MAG: DUF11 domain-containing protein [Planctomycetota bacterium]